MAIGHSEKHINPIRGLAERCPTTGKRQYDTEKEAHKAAKALRKKRGARTVGYVCIYCKLWHIGHWRKPEHRKQQPWNKEPHPDKQRATMSEQHPISRHDTA